MTLISSKKNSVATVSVAWSTSNKVKGRLVGKRSRAPLHVSYCANVTHGRIVVDERAQHFQSDITKQVRKQNDVRDDCTQDKMGDDQLVGRGRED